LKKFPEVLYGNLMKKINQRIPETAIGKANSYITSWQR